MSPTDSGPGPKDPQRRGFEASEAWNAVGTLVAGLAFWGLVGFAIDRVTGVGTVFLPIGLGVGVAAGLYLIIYRMLH
jgi:hypothetical protein